MNDVLNGITEYFKEKDIENKFKTIENSEYMDELIKRNRVPFINIIGFDKTRSPLNNYSRKNAETELYEISIIICQDARFTKDVIKGTKTTESIWSLSDYVYSLIEEDNTFNGVVNRLADQDIRTTLTTLTKDNSVKVALEMKIFLIKDVFK